jgi:hypothetical protein
MEILFQRTVAFLLPTLRRRPEKNNLPLDIPARFLPASNGSISHLGAGPETAREHGFTGREGS